MKLDLQERIKFEDFTLLTFWQGVLHLIKASEHKPQALGSLGHCSTH